MKMLPFVACVAVAGTLAGCQGSAVYYHRDPARQIVVLDQREISILALGNDKWEAYGGKQGGWIGTDYDKQKARQIEAIEKVTGCRVVSTEFPDKNNDNKLLIHATVDCTAQLGR
ncbi:hypothetical protein [Zwartia vadi]|uniref:hypothetical protein n=1 Tax=Zwartia vadi TaxID=3058168 RepID=UPI0025B2DAF6|nr:hypothetical protein [Zwartia vadi]MDN3987823.1 hypothetical protein [Zwartia vadi]